MPSSISPPEVAINAVGWLGTGGLVEIEARQGGIEVNQGGPFRTSAFGAFGGGEIRFVAATDITPAIPQTDPPAEVTTDSPSAEPCDCSLALGD